MTVQEQVKTVEVFDPAMCCSTGVCGPSVDPALSQFAGDLGGLDLHSRLGESLRFFLYDSLTRACRRSWRR